MNEKIEELLEKPIQVRLGILGAAAALLAGGYYTMFYQELGDKLTETTQQVKSIEIEIAEKRGIAANLPKFEMEVARLDVELNKALRELPDKKEIEQLLARISDRARDAGLDIRLFQPMPEQIKDFYAEVPVEIRVGGTFHQVATFFDEVGHLERIVNLNQFEMKLPSGAQREDQGKDSKKKRRAAAKDAGVPIETGVIATSFRFLDETERPKEDEKKQGKRRGKRAKKAKAED